MYEMLNNDYKSDPREFDIQWKEKSNFGNMKVPIPENDKDLVFYSNGYILSIS